MRLKYYLRGLGIGIIVSVFLLAFVQNDNSPMTDQEVISRAEELGMVMSQENVVSPDEQTKDGTGETVADAADKQNNTDNKENSNNSNNKENNDKPDKTDPDKAEADTKEPDADKKDTTVSITVSGGMMSDTIAKELETAGVVDNAVQFNLYLVENGYDSRIITGNKVIPQGATYDEIAQILSSR